MRYRNTKTGAIVDSPCFISGGDWINDNDIDNQSSVKDDKEKNEIKKSKSPQPEKDGITKKDIMQELDSLGVAYNPKATKAELYNLMIGE